MQVQGQGPHEYHRVLSDPKIGGGGGGGGEWKKLK